MKQKIKAIKRNEIGLHCRFCKDEESNVSNPNLHETLGIKGVVCWNCLQHLSSYIDIEIIEQSKGSFEEEKR